MFGRKIKTGSETITGALDLFTNALTELNSGVELSQTEITDTENKLEKERQIFISKEAAAEAKIEANTVNITRATQVKNNIEKLLEGGE